MRRNEIFVLGIVGVLCLAAAVLFLQRRSGVQLWEYTSSDRIHAVRVGPTGEVAVVGDRQIVLLDPHGYVKWTAANPLQGVNTNGWLVNQAGLTGLSNEGQLVRIKDGQHQWTKSLGKDLLACDFMVKEARNGLLWVSAGSLKDAAAAIGIDGSGNVQQRVKLERLHGFTPAALGPDGVIYYIASGQDTKSSSDNRLRAVDAKGKELWSAGGRYYAAYDRPLPLDGGRVALINDAGLRIFDEHGSVVFHDPKLKTIMNPLRRGPNNEIYAFCLDGVRQLSETGQVMRASEERLELHRACITHKGIVVGLDETPGLNPKDYKDNKMYAACYDANLNLRWRRRIAEIYTPHARPDGTVVLPTASNRIECIRP